jgi:UDP-2,4-diacetamido-2,4,6-trideoxy-beta-L-altropyranose hydrolase
MRVAFRADASLNIGTGHVMRCLTLADFLRSKGADCEFICREHSGNLIDFIRKQGFVVHNMPVYDETRGHLSHSLWLGASQDQDANFCASLLAYFKPNWLVVDHYALDALWERALVSYCNHLMVIDDLADRPHACQMLIDQTFGRIADDYSSLIINDCLFLCGSTFALLRPEFAKLRDYSLRRRLSQLPRQLLISMGGVDKDNVTSKVMSALILSHLSSECEITVVMGEGAPNLSEVIQKAESMPWLTKVLVGVNNMAQLMADSDLAIGSGGTTSWERCCLGLPSIILVLAENQTTVAQNLSRVGAAKIINIGEDITEILPCILSELIVSLPKLSFISNNASKLVDGLGTQSVIQNMLSITCK